MSIINLVAISMGVVNIYYSKKILSGSNRASFGWIILFLNLMLIGWILTSQLSKYGILN